MKIRILVAVDRDGRTAATQIYDGDHGMDEAVNRLYWAYSLDNRLRQYRIVEADVLDWQEPPVVQGQATEVTL